MPNRLMTAAEWEAFTAKLMGHRSKHRHERNSWLICGGYIEWCYQCGAFRNLERVPGGPTNHLRAVGKWQKPSGIGGPNPAMKAKP